MGVFCGWLFALWLVHLIEFVCYDWPKAILNLGETSSCWQIADALNKLRLFNNLRHINSGTIALKANIAICKKHLDKNMFHNHEVKNKNMDNFRQFN